MNERDTSGHFVQKSGPAPPGKAEHGPASRLRFEDTPQKDTPSTSGQNVQRSRRGRRPVSDTGPAHTESPDIPGASSVPRDAPTSGLNFEDTPGAPPQDTPPTSGQNVQKSRQDKFKRDGEKARPSDRLRHEDEGPPSGEDSAAPDGEPAVDGGVDPNSGPRPGGKKAARDDQRYKKSKLRMDKSGEKLDNARDKLAKQKPPKKPGPVKTAGRAVGRSVHGYVHRKIYQVEQENVGIEAAHRTELVGESVVRGTSRFINYGYRVHPISGEKNYHKGVDIAMPAGTEILAGQDGTVTFAGDAGDYGLVVVLDNGEGLVSKYAHCSALLVSAGQTVQAGDVIARVGNTGNSTGPHLHLEVIKDGQYLNPLYFAVTNDYGQGPTYGGNPGAAMGDGSYAAMIAEAERYLGYAYVWGGSSPSTSFDCSGYVSL